ncbi:MAG: methionine--tRNA ligase [Candidatus Giovannonibacteria bacterium]|nr:MAG: methionine--tRNA ligase [Candidatus Giovannonibacteria bacterium]
MSRRKKPGQDKLMPEKEKFYITTSIPYLNAPPHLGFALEALQADTLARYNRLSGKDVFFLSGADEHGAKVMRAAEAAGKTPKEFVDGLAEIFQDLLGKLNISNDDFIHTSDQKRHWPGAQLLWKKLAGSGDIYKSFYKGLYCVGHEAFVTEKDLKDGVCELHKKPPEAVEEENYFFKLTKYKETLKKKIESGELQILPDWRKTETLNMLEEIGDISFSRPSKDILWGVPVPGDTSQTMYVWCDALPNYITALGYGGEDGRFEKYWPADVHVIGKDIVKFHTIFWPAMLMSAGLLLPKTIFVHGFINVKGEKMSKSVGNVIDPFPLIEEYGAEAVRFYLAHEISTFSDSDYSPEHFESVYDGFLVNGLGNLLSRVAKMLSTFPAVIKPEESKLANYPLKKNLNFLASDAAKFAFEETTPASVVDGMLWPAYKKAMESYDISQAIKTVWIFLGRMDEYVEEYKPYKKLKSDPEGAKAVLWHLAYSLASCAWMMRPFLPDTAEKILKTLGADGKLDKGWSEFRVGEAAHLFPRLKK